MPVRNTVIGQPVPEEKARRARELRREMTPAESALWQRLRRSQLNGHHFRRQQVIAGFIVDFYCHAAALIVEIDGPIHASQAIEDAERDRCLGERGFRILRFSNAAVLENIEAVLLAIQEACEAT